MAEIKEAPVEESVADLDVKMAQVDALGEESKKQTATFAQSKK